MLHVLSAGIGAQDDDYAKAGVTPSMKEGGRTRGSEEFTSADGNRKERPHFLRDGDRRGQTKYVQ